MRVHDATYQCSLPTEEVISSLSTKGAISMIPILSLKYANYILDRLHQNICSLLSSGGILGNRFSPLEFIMEKLIFDLNVLRTVMEH
jgi:hypothetical protein